MSASWDLSWGAWWQRIKSKNIMLESFWTSLEQRDTDSPQLTIIHSAVFQSCDGAEWRDLQLVPKVTVVAMPLQSPSGCLGTHLHLELVAKCSMIISLQSSLVAFPKSQWGSWQGLHKLSPGEKDSLLPLGTDWKCSMLKSKQNLQLCIFLHLY